MNVFPIDVLNFLFVLVFITYYTFNVDLMDIYKFILETILYKKVVPAMWSLKYIIIFDQDVIFYGCWHT